MSRVNSERVPFTMFTFIVEAPMLSSVTTSRIVRLIIDLVAVLQSERVDVDHDRLFARELDRLADIVDSFAFAGGDQHMRRISGFGVTW